jgi:excisionase family DNA binding protein
MSRPREYPEGTEAVTMKEAARILGIGEYAVYLRIKDGTIPAIRLGKLVRISRKALERILNGEKN